MIKQIKLLKNFLNHFSVDIKLGCKHQQKVAILSLILLLYYIVNDIKKIWMLVIIYRFFRLDKKQKAIIKLTNDDNECFQCAATVMNHKEIGKNSQRISKSKSFINKYKYKGINYPSRKDSRKSLRKIIQHLLLMCYMLKK